MIFLTSKTRFIIVFFFFYGFNISAQTNNNEWLKINNSIIDETLILNNKGNFIPLSSLAEKSIAAIYFDFEHSNTYDSLLNKYAKITAIQQQSNKINYNEIEDKVFTFNTLIIVVNINQKINYDLLNWIEKVAKTKQVVLSLFGDAGKVKFYQKMDIPLLWSPTQSQLSASIVPQIIFGGIASTAKIKNTIAEKHALVHRITTQSTRLKYTIPEEVGVKSKDLKQIDDLAYEAISQKAAPGMVVLAAKGGKVFFYKAYGYHTYEKSIKTKETDIFDVASVTKITATTPAVMRLVEQKKINLDSAVSFYLPKYKNTSLSDIRVREVMLHQAGFIPYIPFQQQILDYDYCTDSLDNYCTKVADGYFVRDNYFHDIMLPKMLNSPLKTRGKYVYSDISMYVMKEVVEQVTGIPFKQYVEENFYKPLAMQKTGYLPRERFEKEKIVPTEEDSLFRKTRVHGYVHDQGAALAGGVAGHAGLFATANDLAIFYQMLLSKGEYGGEKIFEAETVNLFTSKQSEVSRRGLGFDRWDPDNTKKYPSELSSPQTFGHTGYTGTAVWVDPSRDLVFVFLSNRVYPTVTNKLSDLATRRKMLDVFNNAIDSSLNKEKK
ncbi:MAG: serine hydrolase [Sphingobacteriaceae bacterium]|nr:serine hydrolase [Sphingobacteriaceae bacterium]